jgi:hypothetical protein
MAGEKPLTIAKAQLRIRLQAPGVVDQLQPGARAETGLAAENLLMKQAGMSQQAVQINALILDQINQLRGLVMGGDEGLIRKVALHQATLG